MGWFRNGLILLLVLALAGLGACGGGGVTTTPAGNTDLSSQSAFDQWAAAARAEAAPAVSGSGLPTIPYDDPAHGASAQDPAGNSGDPGVPPDPGIPPDPGGNLTIVVLGKDYMKANDGVVDGDALKLGYGDPQPPDPPAYGLYKVSGLLDLQPLSLNVECVPEWGSTYFVGLADYTIGAWHWFPPSDLPEYQIDLTAEQHRFVTDLGNLYFIIVMPTGNQATHSQSTIIAGPPVGPIDPGCPFQLCASKGDIPGAVGLIWNPGPGPLYFEVYRAPAGPDGMLGEFVLIGESPGPQYLDPNLPPGQPFAYKVRAMNGNQPSGFSNIDIGWAGEIGPPPGNGVIDGVLLPIGDTAGGGVALLGMGQPMFCPVGPEGHFHFEGLPAGVFGLVAQHPTREFQPPLIAVQMPENGMVTVEFNSTPLAHPSVAWGVVFEMGASPQDPAMGGGPGFMPLGGIAVQATQNDGTALSTVTDDQGLFFFPGLAAGHYAISAQDENYSFEPPVIDVQVNPGTATPALFFAGYPGGGPPPQPGGMIEGTVTGNGQALGGVAVHLLGLGQPLSVPTDADGHYAFVNLPFQSFLVFPDAPELQFTPRYQAVELPPDGNLSGVDFVGAAPAAADYVWGFIGTSTDPAGVMGGPMDGVTVQVWPVDNPQQVSETTTNADGYFELGGLANGGYIINPLPPANMLFDPPQQNRMLDGTHIPPPAFFTAFFNQVP